MGRAGEMLPRAGPAAGTPLCRTQELLWTPPTARGSLRSPRVPGPRPHSRSPNMKAVGTGVSPRLTPGPIFKSLPHCREPCPFSEAWQGQRARVPAPPTQIPQHSACHPAAALTACVVEPVPQSLTQKPLGVGVSASTGQGWRGRGACRGPPHPPLLLRNPWASWHLGQHWDQYPPPRCTHPAPGPGRGSE